MKHVFFHSDWCSKVQFVKGAWRFKTKERSKTGLINCVTSCIVLRGNKPKWKMGTENHVWLRFVHLYENKRLWCWVKTDCINGSAIGLVSDRDAAGFVCHVAEAWWGATTCHVCHVCHMCHMCHNPSILVTRFELPLRSSLTAQDIPKGDVGEVVKVRVDTGRLVVQFPKGTGREWKMFVLCCFNFLVLFLISWVMISQVITWIYPNRSINMY